jgi:alkaline phosphatase D
MHGYPIFDTLREAEPDLFVALGDMIYADGTCEGIGRLGNAQVPGDFGVATDLEGYLAHWWYNLADPAFIRLRAAVPVVPVWDDHEIVNDSGPHSAGAELLPIAEQALRAAWPLPPDAPLYRSLRWGRHVELFVLDTRSYRDAHTTIDDQPTPKTMLGEAQRTWLLDGLAHSDATWKIVVSSVPLALPTGQRGARDGWADVGDGTGYERELATLLGALRLGEVQGVVFLTTDVHHAEGFRLTPFPDRRDLIIHELVAGPLAAGVFPGTGLDPTFAGRRLFVHEPASADAVSTWDDAQRWFNFGLLEIDADGAATARIVDATGRQVAAVTLERSADTP